jgi:polyisoprenoid-binding protein YceI
MKQILTAVIILHIFCVSLSAEIKSWKVKSGKVFFKSETDLESIWGEGQKITGSLNLTTKVIQIEVELAEIKTDNKLQTSHLHDNYFETAKYPIAKFQGIVQEIKETGDVSAKGTFELHGIKKEGVSLTGKLEKTANGLEQLSYFAIQLADYNIEVPKLVFLKVNQQIQVKVKILWEAE